MKNTCYYCPMLFYLSKRLERHRFSHVLPCVNSSMLSLWLGEDLIHLGKKHQSHPLVLIVDDDMLVGSAQCTFYCLVHRLRLYAVTTTGRPSQIEEHQIDIVSVLFRCVR